MDFLKRLFGGGRSAEGDQDGLYFYIRSRQSGEVIRLRLHRYNDLSQSDDLQGFYAHKTIVGSKSFDRIEADFRFDKSRKLVDADLEGGELVEREDYEGYLAGQATARGEPAP